jgi:predicted GNAT superfamily acetyltransferase
LIAVRPLQNHAEYARAVELQRVIWKFADLEILPVRLFVTAVNVGGMALGAFDGDRMIGFCLAIPGMKKTSPPTPYLHSHMLGVLDEYRNAGVGRALKLEQRRIALDRGIALIEWTFDPFESKNAYFNIVKLGAVVRRFVRNMYGTTSSPLHGGLPTDRCVAEWWVGSGRVERALDGRAAPLENPRRVEVSAKTAASQAQLAAAFEKNLADGYQVTGFDKSGAYLFEGPGPV